MARPRRKPARSTRSKQGGSSGYDKRNARARALGYRNYYDYRLHDNGKQPPGPLRLTPDERARRRGHRGLVDFLASLGEGDLIIMPMGISSVEYDDDRDVYVEIEKLVVDGDTGRERTYVLRNLTRDQLIDTIEAEQARGAVFSNSPSLDQRKLVTDEEAEGGYKRKRAKR